MPPRSSTYKTVNIRKELEILKEADDVKNDKEIARKHKVDPATIRIGGSKRIS